MIKVYTGLCLGSWLVNLDISAELEGALVKLLAQTRRDHKETRARYSVHAMNMKHTFEFVFVTLRDAVFSTYKMAAQTHAKQCPFVQFRKWPPACMPGHVYRPVRPLVLIYNSMNDPHMYMYASKMCGFSIFFVN